MTKEQKVTALTEIPNTKTKSIPLENMLDLAGKGLSHSQIAKILGCSRSNVTARLRKYRAHLQGLKYYRQNRGDVFAIMEKRFLGSITDQDIKEMPTHQRVAVAEKLYNMGRLENGKSTTNLLYAQVDPDDSEALSKFLEEWTRRQLEESREDLSS